MPLASVLTGAFPSDILVRPERLRAHFEGTAASANVNRASTKVAADLLRRSRRFVLECSAVIKVISSLARNSESPECSSTNNQLKVSSKGNEGNGRYAQSVG